ncbi:MAG TPA: UvrD-helicase domain-containing protein [Solirubrobacteraceae bacterium]|nr:UvrD-helicase domain-containing protein [Solirubrobacteraceae bacterium]
MTDRTKVPVAPSEPTEAAERAVPNTPPTRSERILTDEQEQAAARRQGSLLLAAGAGSGKTSVLVERFVRAVREDGLAPGRILVLTFTERAAGELRERVRSQLLDLGEREAARSAEAALVSTFHGFCAQLLRAHPLQAGIEPGFEIMEEGLADRLRVLAFNAALASFVEGERPQAVDLVAAYGADPLRSIVLGAYAQLRSEGQAEPRLPPTAGEDQAARACNLIGELLGEFGAAYAQRKHSRSALDFDDLELEARGLLERRADVREAWAERFELLMVDEFQDSNLRQLQILAALDRDNLFTVGDELQSIYGFRHADVNLFRERQARLRRRGASLALTRNFRSRPAILAAVERVFAERMGERPTSLTPVRSPGEGEEPIVELLLTDRQGWERFPADAELEGMPDATSWRQAEARLLAARVAELVQSGQARAGEIVVLLRALGDLPVYESALRRHGLPTLAGVGGFWSHQQVGDLLAWLRALANPLDELALYSTLASPLVGLSSDGLALIAREARQGRRGVWRVLSDAGPALDAVLSGADRERLASFRELFARERASAALHPISELLRRAIAATGYEAHVLLLSWGERRLANVHKLVRLARRFEAQEGRDLRAFLDHVVHVEVAFDGREPEAPVGDGELEAVRLMSIHAAKGLEFPVVCVADLGREPNLRVPDLLVDGAGGRVGLRLLALGQPEPVSALDFEELREESRSAQLEEEDRILYVACTRAENRLLLSGTVAFERWPASKPGVAPIAWLAPALVPDAPKLAATEGRPAGGLTVELGEGLLVRCVFNAAPALEADPVCATGGPAVVIDGSVTAPGTVATDRSVAAHGAEATNESGPVPGEQGQMSLPIQETLTPRGMRMLIRPAPVPSSAMQVDASRTRPLSDPDGTMSYTSLAELERCGYRYYLERVLGLAENRAAARAEVKEGIEARTRGTIVHMLLESVDFARPQAPSAQEVGRVARRVGASVAPGEREEIAALIASALTTEPARALGAVRGGRREHPFTFSLGSGEPLVTGVLDLIVERRGGDSLIVDYKSDRLSGGEDIELLVQRDYGFQRLLYALAGIEAGAQAVEVAHWFLERPERWVTARFVSDEQTRLRELLRARIDRIRARGFTVTQDPHRGICLTCPGRGGLCSWGETRTMSERSTTLEFDE